MKMFVSALMMVVVMMMASMSFAEGDAKAPKAKSLMGKVVKVDGAEVVISTKVKGEKEAKEVRVTTNADTVVTIDGEAGSVAALTEGMMVKVTPEDGTATKIEAKAKKEGHMGGKDKDKNKDKEEAPVEAPAAGADAGAGAAE